MRVEPLSLHCVCGQPTTAVAQVGLTDEHQLALYWQCSGCHEPVYIFKDLSECWRECPPGAAVHRNEPLEERPDLEAEDFAFLDSMGIRAPDFRGMAGRPLKLRG